MGGATVACISFVCTVNTNLFIFYSSKSLVRIPQIKISLLQYVLSGITNYNKLYFLARRCLKELFEWWAISKKALERALNFWSTICTVNSSALEVR